jgi:hypothetical protein
VSIAARDLAGCSRTTPGPHEYFDHTGTTIIAGSSFLASQNILTIRRQSRARKRDVERWDTATRSISVTLTAARRALAIRDDGARREVRRHERNLQGLAARLPLCADEIVLVNFKFRRR